MTQACFTHDRSDSTPTCRTVSTAAVTPEDLPTVVKLLEELADYEDVRDDFRATEVALRAAMFGPPRLLIGRIARVNGAPAGVILGYETYGTFAATKRLFIEDLFVRPEYRGGGVGRMLIAVFARLALEGGCGGLHWRVLNANDGGIRFYRAIGAVVSTEHRNCSLSGSALHALIDAVDPAPAKSVAT